MTKDKKKPIIIQDYSVIDKWFEGWSRNVNTIIEAVIHHTDGGGNVETLKNWMLNRERTDQYKKGIALFHYAIDKKGSIWEVAPLSRWFYHSSSGKHDEYTIGIELIHKSGQFTEKQYDSLFYLLFETFPKWCKNYNHIVSHDYNYNKYKSRTKNCPGPEFDWDRLKLEINKRKLNFKIFDL
jgi:hypothetical protein